MSDRPDAGERYALLRWFAQVAAVGPAGLCTRCVATEGFTAARLLEVHDGDQRVLASDGDALPTDLLEAAVSEADRTGAVVTRGEGGVGVAAVPLPGTADLMLVLGTARVGGFDAEARTFLGELGDTAAAVLLRDARVAAVDEGPAVTDGTGANESTATEEGSVASTDGTPADGTAAAGEAGGAAGESPGVTTIGDDRSRKLRALQATAQNLVRAGSKTEIAEVAVETARSVLDCPITGVWLYDPESDCLEPAAVTDEGRELLGDPVCFERGEGLAWEAFETGEIGQYDDVGAVEGAYNPSTPIRSEVDVPLGRHGVLTTATTRSAEFDTVDLDLLRILAANTEAVLDRAAREHETERYREMVEAASDPIWAVGTAGNLTEVNQRFVELSGRDRVALVGTPIGVVFSEDLTREVGERMQELREGPADSTAFQEAFRLGEGERREYRVNVSSLYEEGTFAGAVFVAHDVTELRRHEQLLSVFNRVLRHNLRNQLAIVLGNVEELGDHGDPEVVRAAEAATTAVRNLLTLSDKTRRFGAVTDPGGVEIDALDVAAEVRRGVEHVRESHPEATIETDLPDEAWARSHTLLRLAVEELVENAVVHNDRDPEVTVTVEAAAEGGAVEVRVADNGPGVPEMERQVIERGLETPLMHASRLGLWMVRWTADTSGGATEIRDNDPRGTVFVLRLPGTERSEG